MAERFVNSTKIQSPQIQVSNEHHAQETKKTLSKLIKRRKILKQPKERKRHAIYEDTKMRHQITLETLQVRSIIFNTSRILCPAKISSKNKGEMKILQTTNPSYKKIKRKSFGQKKNDRRWKCRSTQRDREHQRW